MAKLAVLLLVALAVYQCSAFRNGCRLPKKVGLCRAAFPRFFYNAKTKKCERFIFGGCRGNANNFKTLAACKAKCTPSKLIFCCMVVTMYIYSSCHILSLPLPHICSFINSFFFFSPLLLL